MIRQIIGGKTVKTVNATGTSADLLALKGLMEGKIVEYTQEFSGGTASATPSALNAKKFSVGKKYVTGQTKSASVTVPHVKTAKTFADINVAVIGQFDESYDSAVKCTYSNLIYDKQEL